MTLLTTGAAPTILPVVPGVSGILKAVRSAAHRAINVLAALLAAPPWRGDIAGLYPGKSSAELMGVSRIERLYAYETIRTL
jgi:hypothetical protein